MFSATMLYKLNNSGVKFIFNSLTISRFLLYSLSLWLFVSNKFDGYSNMHNRNKSCFPCSSNKCVIYAIANRICECEMNLKYSQSKRYNHKNSEIQITSFCMNKLEIQELEITGLMLCFSY